MASTKKADLLIRQEILDLVTPRSTFPASLGDVYRRLQVRLGPVTLGQFHDALRDLVAAGSVQLSPWTQAMYQLNDPETCLLMGREIMAYVSR